MKYIYGKSFTYNYSMHVDGDPIELPASGLISARLYGANVQPTNNQIDRTDTTGHLQEVTVWASGVNNDYSKDITFSGIVDADKFNNRDYDKYYIVVNTILDDNNIEVFNTETIFMYKPDGYSSRINVTSNDVVTIEPKINDLRTTNQITNHITKAKEITLKKLNASGIQSKRLYNLEDLNLIVTYLTLSMISLSLASEQESIWINKYEYYNKIYNDMINNLSISYDIQDDNNPNAEEKTSIAPGMGNIYIER